MVARGLIEVERWRCHSSICHKNILEKAELIASPRHILGRFAKSEILPPHYFKNDTRKALIEAGQKKLILKPLLTFADRDIKFPIKIFLKRISFGLTTTAWEIDFAIFQIFGKTLPEKTLTYGLGCRPGQINEVAIEEYMIPSLRKMGGWDTFKGTVFRLLGKSW